MLPSLCSFSYDADKMAIIKEDINSLNSYSQDCVINFSDVVDAVAELKRGKNVKMLAMLDCHHITSLMAVTNCLSTFLCYFLSCLYMVFHSMTCQTCPNGPP